MKILKGFVLGFVMGSLTFASYSDTVTDKIVNFLDENAGMIRTIYVNSRIQSALLMELVNKTEVIIIKDEGKNK